MYVCGLQRTQLITRADAALSAAQHEQLLNLLEQRKAGTPIAYLTGQREFWSMALQVTAATLIPRADTETLVEQALARIPLDARWHIADLGTGSGAISLALAHERPGCHLVATDISSPALDVARANAQHLGLGNITFRLGSWHQPLQGEGFDMVVSNPPYLRADDAHLLQGDVQCEPRLALVAGADGLDALRLITHHIKPLLKHGAWLLMEHGFDQAGAVSDLLRAGGYKNIQCYQDLAGQDRVSVGRHDD